MNRNLLHRFFEGKTTLEEEKQIRRWLNMSDNNKKKLDEERIAYDALLLTSLEILTKQKNAIFSNPWTISAAAVALLLIVSGLYLMNIKNVPENDNMLLVPAGQRINLILSDGTNVWLNANTSFRYPALFSDKNRTVYLDGEAYFEVSANKKKPFIVKTQQGDIRVTGTSFNVAAYSKFNNFETSLLSGSVDIYKNNKKLVSLNPNQKSTLQNNLLLISEITDTDDFLWKKGLIAFNHKKAEEIFRALEKYFDIVIRFDAEKLPQHTYTGKFRQADGIDYALRVLQKSIRFDYERNDESGIIHINTSNK